MNGPNAIRKASAAERRPFRHTLVQYRIVADHATAEVGRDSPWGNGIDRDPAC